MVFKNLSWQFRSKLFRKAKCKLYALLPNKYIKLLDRYVQEIQSFFQTFDVSKDYVRPNNVRENDKIRFCV